MNEIVKVECLGREIKANRIDGELWFTAREVAEMVGLKSADEVTKLYRRNRAEFLESETCTVTLTVQGQGRKTRLFSLSGVDHIALLARTAESAKLRRWCVDFRDRLRSGASAEITREQFDALRFEMAAVKAECALLRDERGNARVDLRLSLEANAGMSKLASKIMTERRRVVRHEREVELFANKPTLFAAAEQRLLEIDERVIAALHMHGPFDSVAALAKHMRLGVARLGDSISTLSAKGVVGRVDGKVALVARPSATSPSAGAALEN